MKPTTRFIATVFAIIITVTTSGCASILASLSQPGTIDAPKDSRTFGTYVEDQNIEIKIKASLYNTNPEFKSANLSVISFNRVALLVGQVPSEALKKQAMRLAESIRSVRRVHNELSVNQPATVAMQLQDRWIRTKIKAHMIATKGFPSSKVIIVTEAGIVYIMGLLSQQEANWATDLIGEINGVKKIIKIIEYTDAENSGSDRDSTNPSDSIEQYEDEINEPLDDENWDQNPASSEADAQSI